MRFPKIPQNLNRKWKMGIRLGNVDRDSASQGGKGDDDSSDEMKIILTFMMILRMLYKRCL